MPRGPSLRPGQALPSGGSLATRNSQLAAVPSPAPSSSYVFLGAFTPEDELVGYACYGPTPGTDRTFDLYWIAVHPSAQGTGSGTTLISEVERRLRDNNARLLVVETSSRPDYSATLAFYRARGYTEAARVADFYAPADSRVILTKRFRESSMPDITGGELGHHE
ncbi:MAG TPA: GNAT family N-acetyltransferase [Gemmatimonadaceae bacterium]|nr:GNAT family N-acetyltransferase [Gemmatimonadaceae bacterium]